ncbi:MAG TPA: alpha/beta hydrolase-fold protein [Candidatus Saccharimonadaceae bacterium]|nr:alpha/beta hydrolase-fold protein [Candidatus Saccharimonadaceae bacterium]
MLAERILVVPLQSSAFLGGRQCWVFLPRNYGSTSQRYDVLYMLDGQDLFGASSRWRVDQTAEHMIETRQIPGVIIVGIENARGAARTFEYTPWADSFYTLAPSGGGDAFLRAVSSSLIPLVNRRFRTLTGPEHTFLLGASFGGLIASYAGYAFDSTFSRVAAMSPSYWWDHGHMLAFARATLAVGSRSSIRTRGRQRMTRRPSGSRT